MIPKIIHYCWISGEENMPEDIKKCISSWHKLLPDYQIINWNDSNFDWNVSPFVKHCRENNLYAFCSDYIRFWALYNYGGIYLDSDVQVFKSFDKLLKLKRIITRESLFTPNDYIEAAIMGCEKGDEAIGKLLNWYNTTAMKFTKRNYTIAPDVIRECWDKNYKYTTIKNLKDYVDSPDTITLLDVNTYFNVESPKCIAQHQFKNSWDGSFPVEDCTKISNIKVFLCAHKPIENHIPKNDKYVIIDVTSNADNSYNDNYHKVIDISKDPFTKEHNISYGEGCAMRWLYEHPDIIPEYICFGHYRRIFSCFIGTEKLMIRKIDECGAIIKTPFDHSINDRMTNKGGMYLDHQKDDIDTFIQTVKEVAPEYWNSFQEMLDSSYMYGCNCFAMKKEDFLEMCEFCFRVLKRFDEKMGYRNNEDVFQKMHKLLYRKHLRFGINWQVRLEGFLLEWLTETYYRHKWGVDKCCKAEANIPEERISRYEGHTDNRKRLNWEYFSI